MDIPGGTVDKSQPADAGDTGSIPGSGRFLTSNGTVSGNIREAKLSSASLPLSTIWTQHQEGNVP